MFTKPASSLGFFQQRNAAQFNGHRGGDSHLPVNSSFTSAPSCFPAVSWDVCMCCHQLCATLSGQHLVTDGNWMDLILFSGRGGGVVLSCVRASAGWRALKRPSAHLYKRKAASAAGALGPRGLGAGRFPRHGGAPEPATPSLEQALRLKG